MEALLHACGSICFDTPEALTVKWERRCVIHAI